jgi:hypothetical protein
LPEQPCSHVSLFARTAFVAREPHTEIEIEQQMKRAKNDEDFRE